MTEEKKCQHCGQPINQKTGAWGHSSEKCSNVKCPSNTRKGWGN